MPPVTPLPAAIRGRVPIREIATRACRWGLEIATWAGATLCAAGIALRLTVRDTVPGLAVVFYATPLALVATGLLCAALCFVLRRRRWAARLALSMALVCGVWWWQSSCYTRGRPTPSDPLRVLLWNVARGEAGWDAVADELADREAPLIALVEAGGDTPARRQFWHRLFPEHRAVFCGHQLVLLVRGDVLHVHAGSFEGTGWFGRVDVRIDGREFTAVIVDIHSNPLRNRSVPLGGLADLCERYCERPTIILGDFNTPAESAALDRLRSRFRHAFEVAGDGLAATWPVPVPVLGLDHIWIDRRFEAHRVEHGWSAASDHRPVAATLSLRACEGFRKSQFLGSTTNRVRGSNRALLYDWPVDAGPMWTLVFPP